MSVLLRQPHCFEGLRVITEELHPLDLPISHREDPGKVRGDIDAATLPCTSPIAPDKHSIHSKGASLLNLPTNAVPGLADLVQPGSEGLHPVERLGLREYGAIGNGLDVGCVE